MQRNLPRKPNGSAQRRGDEAGWMTPGTFTYTSVLKEHETHNHCSPTWCVLEKVNHTGMTRKRPSEWQQECSFDTWVSQAKRQDVLPPGFFILASYVCPDSHPNFSRAETMHIPLASHKSLHWAWASVKSQKRFMGNWINWFWKYIELALTQCTWGKGFPQEGENICFVTNNPIK